MTRILRVATRAATGAVAAFGLLLAAGPAKAQTITEVAPVEGPRVEVGLQAGYPTGFTGKMWTSERNAIDGTISWGLGTGSFLVYGDWLHHTRSILARPEDEARFRMPLYYGIGPRLIRYSDGSAGIGPRFPLGVTAILQNAPVSFFGEVAPGVELGSHGTILTADAEVGARLWF